MAVPACWSTWARVIAAVSAAKSASMMRLRAAVWLSTATCRLEMTDSKRFWAAPYVARSVVTMLISVWRMVIAAVALATSLMFAVAPVVTFVTAALVDRSVVVTVMALLVGRSEERRVGNGSGCRW